MASILTSATIDEPGRAYSNDPEEDFDEVRRMVDRAKRGTERVNLRAARRLAADVHPRGIVRLLETAGTRRRPR